MNFGRSLNMMSSYRELVEHEYVKNALLKKEDVQIIQEWIKKQHHLPKIMELQIIIFLHRCDYSIENAKKRLEMYFTFRTMMQEVFTNRNPIGQNFIDMALITVLPKPTPEGYRILYYRYLEYDFDKQKPLDRYKLLDMAYSLNFYQEGTCNGYLTIFDCDVATLRHVAETDLVKLRKYMYYVQKILPTRTKGIHIINTTSRIHKFLPLIRPFLSEKMRSRLHIHDKPEMLLKFMPKECLPNEYGGTSGTIEEIRINARNNLLTNSDFFVEEEKQVVDESKRLEELKDLDEIFGTEGTFKQLDFD